MIASFQDMMRENKLDGNYKIIFGGLMNESVNTITFKHFILPYMDLELKKEVCTIDVGNHLHTGKNETA